MGVPQHQQLLRTLIISRLHSLTRGCPS
jgi:hypothetical protein